LLKILSNPLRKPQEAKFRCLKLSNAKIATIVATPGALDLLLMGGWVKEDDTLLSLAATGDVLCERVFKELIVHSSAFWVAAQNGAIPKHAVVAGVEADGSTVLYLGRASIGGGGMHIGKAAQHLGGCNIGYGGGERQETSYEILCSCGGLELKSAQGGVIPDGVCHLKKPRSSSLIKTPPPLRCLIPLLLGAIGGGWEGDGSPLYAACASQGGGVHPGKAAVSFGGCNIGYGGGEQCIKEYQVFCYADKSLQSTSVLQAPTVMRRFLTSFSELLSWTPSVASDQERSKMLDKCSTDSVRKRRVLHCHDLKGGYCTAADEDYLERFDGWECLDMVCYFSHHRVSVPPAVWIREAHSRGKPVLGTIITEHAVGLLENELLLCDVEGIADQLISLSHYYGFDGWLVNIEAPLPCESSQRFAYFLRYLTEGMKRNVGDHAMVLYYDSLDAKGLIQYQNELVDANKLYFDSCDGIFLNYWWTEAHLRRSRALAGIDRQYDVFAGVDVFARGKVCHKEGPGCKVACDKTVDCEVSVALFAPGWVHENGPAKGQVVPELARLADRGFWEALFGPVGSLPPR